MASELTPARRAIRNQMTIGLITVAVLVAGFGGWAFTANLSSAVMAMGNLVVEGNIKRVQHREGGIVGQINVREGDLVGENDLLVRLDDTLTRASLAIVEKQLDQFDARRMRLFAERDDATELAVPESLAARRDDPAIAELVESEIALFKARNRAIEGQKRQLRERIGQIEQEKVGLAARRDAKGEELELIEEELKGVEDLYKKGLISMPRYAELRRVKAQLAGELGQLIAELARAATRITETELQIIQLDENRRAEVLSELREIDARVAQLSEQRNAAADQLRRIEIRAPQAGIVHQLQVHTVGGVIGPGETLMQIVPSENTLVVEARVQPTDIDQVHVGQIARLRFSAFNQRTTPEIDGHVLLVGADLVRHEMTGEAWYVAKIGVEADELARLGNLGLIPGMPVEAFIQTGERTASSYLLKPLTDQLARAFREQ